MSAPLHLHEEIIMDDDDTNDEKEREQEDTGNDVPAPETPEVDVLRAEINSLKALNDELSASNVKLQGANDALMETNRELMDRLGLPSEDDDTDSDNVTLDKILEGIV